MFSILLGDRSHSQVKYVSLLAFNKIVRSHPHLVFRHEEVITACIDDADVSIRLQALDLIAGIANSDNLIAIIERLLIQLEHEPGLTLDQDEIYEGQPNHSANYSINDDAKAILKSRLNRPPLPVEYKLILVRSILDICSKSMYSNIKDFEWYIDVLLRLFKTAPTGISDMDVNNIIERSGEPASPDRDVFSAMGWQLRNVAVRVDAVRPHAVLAALSLMNLQSSSKSQNTLSFAAWIVGEYIRYNADPIGALEALFRNETSSFSSVIIYHHVQAILKVFAHCLSETSSDWRAKHHTVLQRQKRDIVLYLIPLASHQDLEVQERAVGFLELLGVTDSASKETGRVLDEDHILLAKFLPQLFNGFGLNPVAPLAQRKVPIPFGLDLQANFNEALPTLLGLEGSSVPTSPTAATFHHLYHFPTNRSSSAKHQVYGAPSPVQHANLARPPNGDERETKHHQGQRETPGPQSEDPFYLALGSARSPAASPFHGTIMRHGQDSLDLDSIPIMNLDVQPSRGISRQPHWRQDEQEMKPAINVLQDADIDGTTERQGGMTPRQSSKLGRGRPRTTPLGLITIDRDRPPISNRDEKAASNADWKQDVEMANALAEVERLRLEMQRESDRVEAADGAPAEGTLVKQKMRRKVKPRSGSQSLREGQTFKSAVPVTKRKRPKKKQQQSRELDSGGALVNDA